MHLAMAFHFVPLASGAVGDVLAGFLKLGIYSGFRVDGTIFPQVWWFI